LNGAQYLYHSVFVGTSRQASEHNLPAKPFVPLVKRSHNAIDVITKTIAELNAHHLDNHGSLHGDKDRDLQMYLRVCLDISKKEPNYRCLPPEFHDSKGQCAELT
jgi:hypothetical protein